MSVKASGWRNNKKHGLCTIMAAAALNSSSSCGGEKVISSSLRASNKRAKHVEGASLLLLSPCTASNHRTRKTRCHALSCSPATPKFVATASNQHPCNTPITLCGQNLWQHPATAFQLKQKEAGPATLRYLPNNQTQEQHPAAHLGPELQQRHPATAPFLKLQPPAIALGFSE